MSARPPGAFGSTASSNGASTSASKSTVLDEEDLLIPPWFGFLKSVLGIIAGLLANIWQGITTFTAFQVLILIGPAGRGASARNVLPVDIICLLIAVAIQLGVVLFVFKVGKKMKNSSLVKSEENLLTKLKHTAVQLDNRDILFLVFVGIAFVGDTIGDVTFVNTYTNSPFIIFFYAACLYAASTVLLAKSLESFWASQVAYMQWRTMMSRAHGGHP